MQKELTAIEQIHEDVFEFLLDKHFEEKKMGNDFFFKARYGHEAGKERYWLLGDEHFVAVSFWTGTDKINRIPKIYIEIDISGKLTLVVRCTGNDEEIRELGKLVYHEFSYCIDGLEDMGDGVFEKIYTENHKGNYIEYIEDFIVYEKPEIDNYLENVIGLGVLYGIENDINEYNKNYYLATEANDKYSITFPRRLFKEEFYGVLTDVLYRKYNVEDGNFLGNVDDSSQGLKYAIKSFEIRNFRGIDKLGISDIPEDTKWIVLTGNNGYGKTSVLQGIALGLCGKEEADYKLGKEGYVMVKFRLLRAAIHINLSFNFNLSHNFIPLNGDLAAYGPTRLRTGTNIKTPLENLFATDENLELTDIDTELLKAYGLRKERYELLVSAFLQLIPDIVDITVDSSGKDDIVKYFEKESNIGVTFDQLATGYKNIMALVGDIVYRLSKSAEKLNDLSDLKGIIIIDEFELHLHPKYQKSLPKALTEIFPNVLFIISTHSPIPLLGMPRETVLIKVDRTKEKGITAERLDVDFSKLLPDAILTSPIFGFHDIIPNSIYPQERFRTESDYGESQFNELMEKRMLQLKEKYRIS